MELFQGVASSRFIPSKTTCAWNLKTFPLIRFLPSTGYFLLFGLMPQTWNEPLYVLNVSP